ncbi:MAG: ATP-binding protein [Melioribacteraceae bacterium]|nr:ATP-binding protein [Melioribacteraceae bacterium]MDD3559479.1 ATP-binding protein [Melioribacteraceae bacterium]
MSRKVFTRTIISDPDLLPEIEDFIQSLLKEQNVDDEKINALVLSVAEAASNAILHGNKNDKKKKVFILMEVDDDRIIIRIKDEGKGFDPSKVPDPTIPENILKDSGRGIHIMNTFLDRLTYKFTDNGTEAILELNLN